MADEIERGAVQAEATEEQSSTRKRSSGSRRAKDKTDANEPKTAYEDGWGLATERANEMIDQAGQRVGSLAWALGRQARRLASLAREEAEDMWAEAQSLRRGRRG